MSNLAKKLSKNSDLLLAYNEIIKNQLNHSPITRDGKIKKICMVYDVSSNASGSSLNDCLYPGPALCEGLLGVLL